MTEQFIKEGGYWAYKNAQDKVTITNEKMVAQMMQKTSKEILKEAK